ncbi:PAS domain S-box protein [Methanobacterium subterraneum]|uniref:Diguanylate cyclase n=2 Tax=Methanobacterium TaxID=2160 RepID=A0A2H4VAF3_9EURY|nr:response regulator [Methanobacterium subterraneum]AUB55071.1 diguanylate cyclase [Methanobacterium subterraneum]AUB57948.1 diguanylate cyclase [Methanobacterium sp. MZ-A1]NMO09230.1 PAS domain S-box protein [Methanobacterium subterraneum]
MADEIRVLILEDVPLDAELIETQLKREGLQFTSKIVEKEDDYRRELVEFQPSIILADHSLPQFDGITAMNLAREITPNTPFIFVSGKIGEDFAVEMLKEGATDYVLKNNLSKLPHSVVRALKEAKEKLEKSVAEQALKEREEKYRTLFEYFPNYVVVLGLDGKIIDLNHAAAKFSPLSRDDTIGMYFTDLQSITGEDSTYYQELFSKYLKGEDVGPFESRLITREGEIRLMEIYPAPLLKNGELFAVQVIAQDITDRKKAETEINASLKEKEMLLGEINGRVRNYMNMISSLLELQSVYMKDEENREVLKDNKNRVKSMLLIHDGFSQSEDFALIDFSQYIKKIIELIISSYHVDTNRIKMKTRTDGLMLDIDAAIPCGLIINELLTNAVKHAFPGTSEGEISVEFGLDNHENNVLIVNDNGVGLSPDIGFKDSGTMGFQLVNTLVNQLDGSIILSRDKGTTFQIIWSESEY